VTDVLTNLLFGYLALCPEAAVLVAVSGHWPEGWWNLGLALGHCGLLVLYSWLTWNDGLRAGEGVES
jgi:hypothetical protein